MKIKLVISPYDQTWYKKKYFFYPWKEIKHRRLLGNRWVEYRMLSNFYD